MFFDGTHLVLAGDKSVLKNSTFCSIVSVQELDENGTPRKKGTPSSLKKKKKKKKRSFPLTALSCGICGQTFKFETHYEPHIKAHEEKLDLNVQV